MGPFTASSTFPRSKERGLIEAVCFTIGWISVELPFRVRKSAASLKPGSLGTNTGLGETFRVRKSAASLKRVLVLVARLQLDDFPRSKERGLIEAHPPFQLSHSL